MWYSGLMGSKVGRLSSILSLSYPALEPKGARTIVQPQKLFTSVLQTTYFSSNGNIYYILTDTFLSECVNDLLFASLRTPADHVGSLAVTAAFMARRFNDRFSRDVSCVFFQSKTFSCLKRNVLLFFFLKCLLDLPLVCFF